MDMDMQMLMKEIFDAAIAGDKEALKETIDFLEGTEVDELRQQGSMPGRHVENFFKTYGELIKENGYVGILIDVIIELMAGSFIKYIVINIKEYIGSDVVKIRKQIDRIADVILEINDVDLIKEFTIIAKQHLSETTLVKLANAVRAAGNISDVKMFMCLHSDMITGQLVGAVDEKIDELIREGNIDNILKYVEEHSWDLNHNSNDEVSKSVKKLIDFVIATNNPKYIYLLASTNEFGQNHDLLNALIKINIPAFIYLYAATIENISKDDMELIVAYMLTANDTKLIGYLLWHLRDKNNVANDLKLALQNKLNESNDKYWFISYDVKTPNKLKDALLSDDIQMLAEFGIVLNENNLYDDKKQLVLANIPAGL